MKYFIIDVVESVNIGSFMCSVREPYHEVWEPMIRKITTNQKKGSYNQKIKQKILTLMSTMFIPIYYRQQIKKCICFFMYITL